MTDRKGFIINMNEQAPDVIHDADNLSESCNTDDAIGKHRVDYATGVRMIEVSPAQELERCGHCMTELRG